MDDELADIAAACLCVSITITVQKRRRKRHKPRTIWVKPWIATRQADGAFHKLLIDLVQDPYSYKNFLRVDFATFEALLAAVEPLITKNDTTMRASIPPAEQLALTLRFLATGESYTSLQYYQFRIGKSTLSALIPSVCEALSTCLAEYIKCPNSEEEWEEIAQRFYQRWQLPNCLGAIDGKRVRILHPPSTGSDYYNYKGYFSLVLMAVAGSNCELIFADVGCQGRISGGGVLRNTLFYQAVEKEKLNIPAPKALPIEDIEGWKPVLPYFFVGDDAFSLTKHLMKPYPNRGQTEEQRIFNYRMSRARRVSENAFGLLTSRFRVYHTTLSARPNSAINIVHATLILHNYLLKKCPTYSENIDNNSSDGTVDELHHLPSNMETLTIPGCNHPKYASEVRDTLSDYLNGPGQVPWQWNLLLP